MNTWNKAKVNHALKNHQPPPILTFQEDTYKFKELSHVDFTILNDSSDVDDIEVNFLPINDFIKNVKIDKDHWTFFGKPIIMLDVSFYFIYSDGDPAFDSEEVDNISIEFDQKTGRFLKRNYKDFKGDEAELSTAVFNSFMNKVTFERDLNELIK